LPLHPDRVRVHWVACKWENGVPKIEEPERVTDCLPIFESHDKNVLYTSPPSPISQAALLSAIHSTFTLTLLCSKELQTVY